MKLASLMNGELTPQMMTLKNILLQTDVGKMTVRISGKDALLTLTLHFYDPAVAQKIFLQLKPVVDALGSQPILQQYVQNANVSMNGDLMIITGAMDVRKGWALIQKFHQ